MRPIRGYRRIAAGLIVVVSVIAIASLSFDAPRWVAIVMGLAQIFALPAYANLRPGSPSSLSPRRRRPQGMRAVAVEMNSQGEPHVVPHLSGRPPPLATFRGRHEELHLLLSRFHLLQSPNASNGAIILAIHGMPGVGKSALAHELARRLTVEFPDGLLYANLGNAESMRTEAEILNRFLRALNVPREEIPTSTVERAALFRSSTSSLRMLLVLDAARDHEQVARLLPSGDKCAVIVTSRRDLGPALGVQSMWLRVPDMDGALDILHAVSNTEFGEDQKFAIEIVRRAGFLPLAIRAAGDVVVQQMQSLDNVARFLRDPDRRQAILQDHGRSVEERIDTEYGRLTSDEQTALRLLSLIDSPSFVPWVLSPLLGLGGADDVEVEKVISRLAERQLLEPAGVDMVSGVDRYRFHPLIRAFAENRSGQDDAVHVARRNLDDAYLEVVNHVLAMIDPDFLGERSGASSASSPPLGSSVTRRVATFPDRWVRAEYANLVRCVPAAYAKEQWGSCWHIAARLGDCASEGVDPRSVRAALDLGQEAARRDETRHGEAEVMLARGGWLTRVGEFGQAYDALSTAGFLANRLRERADAARIPRQRGSESAVLRRAYRLEGESFRRLAEAHLSLGAYRDAAREIGRAHELARATGDVRQIRLLRLMMCHVAELDPGELSAGDDADDDMIFWHASAMAEHERRHGRSNEAADRLQALRLAYEDDAARTYAILVRIVELGLEDLKIGSPRDDERAKQRALHRAAEAINGYQILGDAVGAVRARCMLVRAMVVLQWTSAAKQEWQYVVEEFGELDQLIRHDRSPLRAALWRADGELLRQQGDFDAASVALARAACLFRAHGDRSSEDSAMRALGLDALPPDVFEDRRPGRDVRAVVERADGELRVDEPVDVVYSLDAPALVDGHFPAGGRYLTVLLTAAGASVEPTTQTVRLDSWAPLEPVRFRVTPNETGTLRMKFLVFAAREGSLLQECHIPPRVVVGRVDQGVVA